MAKTALKTPKVAGLAGRSVAEWIGKTPDAKVPKSVRARIFEREKGTCHISGLKINPPGDLWELEHKIPLSANGEHRETNLFPALADKHKAKTKGEATERAKINRVRNKHNGIVAEKPKIPSPPKAAKVPKDQREPKPPVFAGPRRSIFRDMTPEEIAQERAGK